MIVRAANEYTARIQVPKSPKRPEKKRDHQLLEVMMKRGSIAVSTVQTISRLHSIDLKLTFNLSSEMVSRHQTQVVHARVKHFLTKL